SAFLLFQIQPVVGKYILPWFGGGFAVWTVCMLFFQVLLLGGYVYAHLISRFELQTQGKLHSIIVICTLVLIISLSFVWETPITPGSNWKPPSSHFPTWYVLRLLTVSVGLPYFLLSTTSPLIQAWFSKAYRSKSPYPFYAVSNVASLFALVSYPILFEPFMSLRGQAIVWSLLYVIYALILGCCIVQVIRFAGERGKPGAKKKGGKTYSRGVRAAGSSDHGRPNWKTHLLWASLATCASVMLLATTNQMCQDVAAIPFLWVLPLSLYLISFVISFNDKQEHLRDAYTLLLFVALFLGWWNLRNPREISIFVQLPIYSFVLLVCCVFCHSELYRRRPNPRYLTSFYLMLAIGGAVGGVLVSLMAPIIFTGFWEYHLGLISCSVIVIAILFQEKNSQFYHLRFPLTAISVILAVLIGLNPTSSLSETVEMSRNFYGVLRVRQARMGDFLVNGLMHGSIFHGWQVSGGPYHRRPTTYYTENSGVGLALTNHPKRASNKPLRIGVVGLGIGTLASYGGEGDYIKFYEIDPNVVRVASDKRYFTYLSDCKAQVDIVLGDARLALERELKEDAPQQYDVLVVDAFTSDAIPVHLLTKEAFEVYLSHLNSDGILAIHVTNRHMNLVPVAWAIKTHFGLDGVVVESVRDSDVAMTATWILLTNDEEFLENPAIVAAKDEPDGVPGMRLWTDDYSNIYQVLR
ncbi:MAG: fused MFS/spermidine synthase, partial [Chloroflexota bacterium]|nr:fused MFS/spermidine synthase [Chloroflexota bacterium]